MSEGWYYAEGDNGEIARILRETARLVENGIGSGDVRDINGNTVGEFELEGSRQR